MITSWKDLDLKRFVEIYKITSSDEDEDTQILKCVGVLNDMTYDEILNLSLNDTAKLVKGTAFLYTRPEKKKVKKYYRLGGKKYFLTKDVSDMTTAQYIDYQSIANISTELLPQFMAIFLIPKGHKYNDGYKLSDAVKDIEKDLSVEEALSLADFFVSKCSRLMKRTLLYLEAQMTTEKVLTKDKEMKKFLTTTIENLKLQRRSLDMCGLALWKQ